MESVTYPIGPVDAGCCLWCGEVSGFTKLGTRAKKWCSDECATRASMYRRTGHIVTGKAWNDLSPTCKGCGAEIVQGPRARNPKQWCSGACRAKWYRNREDSDYYENQLSEGAAKTAARNAALPDKRCEQCGEVTPRTQYGRPLKYCSNKCMSKHRYEMAKESGPRCSVEGCEKPRTGRGLCGSHYSAVWRAENPDKHSAKNLRYRAQKRHDGAESFSRLEVLELSSWECHLCGDPIDPECEYPSPLYGTVDHVVPLSKGGTHTLCNVKAAHHICNSTKRDNEDFKLVR